MKFTAEQLELIEKKRKAMEAKRTQKQSNDGSIQTTLTSFFKPVVKQEELVLPVAQSVQTSLDNGNHTFKSETVKNESSDDEPLIERSDIKQVEVSSDDEPLKKTMRRGGKKVNYIESSDDETHKTGLKKTKIEEDYLENEAMEEDNITSINYLPRNSKTNVYTPTLGLAQLKITPVEVDSTNTFNRLQSFAAQPKSKKNDLFSKKINNGANTNHENGKSDSKEVRFSWLVDIKDENGNKPDHPNYDPRTLYIPPYAWNKFTPFERQFWEIKCKNYNSVVFFKKGKFYELYENDADIGHQEFDLKLTDRVNMKMVGVPESSFDMWASKFISKGYKIAKVEQMESALGKEMRDRGKKVAKEDKIVKRELTSILTAGTLIDPGMLNDDMSTFTMAIKEQLDPSGLANKYGIAIIDTSTSEFQLCHFEDDADFTLLDTLIMQVKPRELVYAKHELSKKALKIFDEHCENLIKNVVSPGTEFWSASTTLDEIRSKNYFGNDEGQWPLGLQVTLSSELALSAFGGLIWYLRSLKLDQDLLSLCNVSLYSPIKLASTLVLDGQSLNNLEVLQNNMDGSVTGTILQLLNHCVTPFGKRLFRKWLCHPLRHIPFINARLDAIEDINGSFAAQKILSDLRDLPDLERMLSRVHSKRIKISEFISIIRSFKMILSMTSRLQQSFERKIKSKLLDDIFASIPNLAPSLSRYDNAFNHELALAEGTIIPFQGFSKEYDAINDEIAGVEQNLNAILEEQKKKLKCKTLSFRDMGKELYQLEVPFDLKVPDSWMKLSQNKQLKRYRTPETATLVKILAEKRETRSGILKSLEGKLYGEFDEHYKEWITAVNKVASLDCLYSLATAVQLMGEPCCRPEFVPCVKGKSNFFEVVDLRHPCLNTGPGTDFIPNDTYLGGWEGNNNAAMVLLTGPNMGGKSTLLRQTCVAIIMAQLGCYVPATRCKLTPFDRIFTRIGANDNILAGQSTFMVELAETAKILKEATPHSLVILDELGRGTSTFDGYAIAFAVLYHLVTKVGCLGLFSTHYGMLTSELGRYPNLALMYMSCLAEPGSRDVTFLYKLIPGVCPKSYGMNVASMAGLPAEVIVEAERKAQEFEQQHSIPDTSSTLQQGYFPLALEEDLNRMIEFLGQLLETNQTLDPSTFPNHIQLAIRHWSLHFN